MTLLVGGVLYLCALLIAWLHSRPRAAAAPAPARALVS
jgi:hypothetical protein